MSEISDTAKWCVASKPARVGNKLETSGIGVSGRCPVCGKHLKSSRSYAGHMWLAHQQRVGFVAIQDEKIAKAYDMAIAVNRRLDRVEEAIAHLALYTDRSDEAFDAMGKFFRGEAGLKQEYQDMLYKGKKS